MTDRERTIKWLECCGGYNDELEHVGCSQECPYWESEDCCNASQPYEDALKLLKEQEGYVSVPFSWLVKFCTHIDFKEPVTDEERELLWKQKLKQQFGIDLEGRS